MARTPKTYRLSDDTLAYLEYLHDALPDRTDTALIELAVSALVGAIEHAGLNARTQSRLSKNALANSWVQGYDEGTQDTLSKTGLSYTALVDAFERRAENKRRN